MKTTSQTHIPKKALAGFAVAAFLITGCADKMNNQAANGTAAMEKRDETVAVAVVPETVAVVPEASANTASPATAGAGTKYTYVQPPNLAGDEKKMVIDARGAAFKQLDTDQDGIVEKDEFYDGLYALMDANRDNAVNAEELDREVAFWNRNGFPALASFADWDADADREVSKEEFRHTLAAVIDVPNGETLAQNLYVVWDTDNDKRIEMLELENVVIRFDADNN